MDCKDDFVDTLLSLARHNMQDTVHTLAAADIQMRRPGLLLGRELIEGESKGLEMEPRSTEILTDGLVPKQTRHTWFIARN